MLYSIVRKRKHTGFIQSAALSFALALALGGNLGQAQESWPEVAPAEPPAEWRGFSQFRGDPLSLSGSIPRDKPLPAGSSLRLHGRCAKRTR